MKKLIDIAIEATAKRITASFLVFPRRDDKPADVADVTPWRAPRRPLKPIGAAEIAARRVDAAQRMAAKASARIERINSRKDRA